MAAIKAGVLTDAPNDKSLAYRLLELAEGASTSVEAASWVQSYAIMKLAAATSEAAVALERMGYNGAVGAGQGCLEHIGIQLGEIAQAIASLDIEK